MGRKHENVFISFKCFFDDQSVQVE
jgi:hypothetical protein